MASKGGAKVAKPKLGKNKTKLGKAEAGKPCKPRQTPVNPGKCVILHAGEALTPQEPAGPDLDVTKLEKLETAGADKPKHTPTNTDKCDVFQAGVVAILQER